MKVIQIIDKGLDYEVLYYVKYSRILKSLWIESKSFNEFKYKLLSLDPEDIKEDFYAKKAYYRLSKDDSDHWYKVRKLFGKKCFKTWSDVGSLKINNLLIPNHHGDGTTRVAIFEKEDLNSKLNYDLFAHLMNDTGFCLTGKSDIYDYDVEGAGKVIKTIEGKYFIFVYDGLIALVEFY